MYEKHEQFMYQALRFSQQAIPHCLPNPPVGCVVVRDDKLIASGYTRAPGLHHAEVDALSQIEGSLHNVSVYVTLEPCSFYGRTPPCATALIDRNVNTVYVAMLDPDPRNNGKGIEMLQCSGIKVKVGILAETVAEFLSPYLLR